MVSKIKGRLKAKLADTYLKLVIEFPLVSIKLQTHADAAQAMIDRLTMGGPLDQGEELYLDALSDLLAAFEDVHHPIPAASDADMLRHLMDAKNITQVELHRQTGIPRSSISEVLAGKRPFSKTMIRTLADFFNIDSSVLASNL